MNYAGLFFVDTANGVGLRTNLFVSGCTHHCEGCFNRDTWDFNYGQEYTKETEDKIIESLKPNHIAGLTILGGEPMELANQQAVRNLVERVRQECPHSTIWIYSGYTYEELTDISNKRCYSDDTDVILSNIDILVDGEFILAEKNLSHRFKGSSNQRVIDVPKTRESGVIVLSEYND